MSNSIQSVSCPTCHKQVDWIESNTFRPFCCERCKLIDFGGWATEKHSIPGAPLLTDGDPEEEPLQ